ncbi:hypothetical protein FKW77_002328 [Venturia effusa]|uniref:Kinetochore protein fta7 n=1 Tax=Venturia effusa TaxID=50376 RepID=A0A517LDC6_9PEZI|nr:hypothetical protein FKW77_002328 [Venturia effusa]
MPRKLAKRRRDGDVEVPEDENETPTARIVKRKRKRGTADQEVDAEDEISVNPPPMKKGRQEDDERERRKEVKHDYAYLKPTTRKILQEVIQSDWKKLPEPAQRQVQMILLTAKRTALNSIEPKRRKEVEYVLDVMHRKLEKRLPRSPFPPFSKAGHFNLEEQIERSRILMAEHIPATDSVKLLEEEIEREERRIQDKRDQLAELEKNAKLALQQQKKRSKATHPLLHEIAASARHADSADNIGLAKDRNKHHVFDEVDKDLAPLLSQLRSHLESIRANGNQLEGVEGAIADAQAALRIALQAT